MYVNTGFVQVMENMESHYFSFQARQSGKIIVCVVRKLLPVLKQGRNKIHSCQKIPENKDDFEKFQKWLDYMSWKTGKSHGI